MNGIPDLPEEIKIAAEEKRLLIFLGAGISCAAGLPCWNRLKEELLQKCIDKFDPDSFEHIKNWPYYSCFKEIFTKDPITYKAELSKALVCSGETNLKKFKNLIITIKKLEPFSIITTNVDSLLKQCGVYKQEQFRYREECCPNELRNDKVFCIHGDMKNAIMNSFDLRNLYKNPDFENFVYNVFGSYSVLFLGYSLTEAELLKFATVNNHYQTKNRNYNFHYALYPSDKTTEDEFFLREYGIKILKYDNTSHDYAEFIPTIEYWGTLATPGPEVKRARGKKDSRSQVQDET